MKKFTLLLLFNFVINTFFSQDWTEKMQDPNANFYQIQADFNNHWSTRDNTEKGKGYKAFKRWENFVERRVYPSGNLSLLSLTAKNFQAFLDIYQPENTGNKFSSSSMLASATWTPIGPMGAISGNAGGQLLKSGRMCFITVDPTNSNNLWVGAPAGGLWKSTNGGVSWTTNTDNLGVLGCSDLAIDPTNTSIMYLATGDGDAGDTRSIGVLKSTNGGITWVTTGLTNAVTNNFTIRRLIVNPSNPLIVLAATSGGIYRTINGGTNWTQVATGSTFDLEFKPGTPTTVYAGGTTFRISTDGGATFTVVNAGIPSTGVNRMAIAVTPADVNYVYVLASKSSDNGFQGFYRSVNSAAAFTQMATTPNLLGWATAGTDAGGQGWYDLCIAASPTNPNDVVTGGVNVWRTTNGGTSWTIYGHWTGSGAPFTHADHHDLEYDAAGTLFNTNDGTVYRRTATAWQEISGTINISQIYKIGLSTLTANKWITGHQDNGTSIWNGTTYNAALGGDGMDCFIDRTNDNNMFGEYYNGALRKSTNGGVSWSTCTTGMTGTAPWVTAWKQDPLVAANLYCGYTNLFKSTNSAGSWTQLTALPITGSVKEFAIAPSNNQVIYVLKNSGICKTTDGGATWTNVTGTVPVGSASPEFITIDPTDPNNAWVVLSGYSAANKVFMTANGGTSWTNFTANLPNIPANCSVYQPGTADRIYIGMDVGVYYRDNVSATWTLYNAGLPNMPLADMEISPANPTKLVAASYGRGVWVVDVVGAAPPPVPVTNFSVTAAPKCAGALIPFTDQSSNTPNTWSWSVLTTTGVTIASATSQNPNITFANAGNYTVTLIASNGSGPGSTFNQAVTITALPNVVVSNSVQSICSGTTVAFTASGATTYNWSNGGGTTALATYTPAGTTVYTVTGTTSGCSSSKTTTVTVNTIPNVVVSNSVQSICSGSTVAFTAAGAIIYTWSNGGGSASTATYAPTGTTTYTVTGTTSGCSASKTATVTLLALPTINATPNNSIICVGQPVILNATGATTYSWMPGNLTGSSVTYTPASSAVYTVTGTGANGCKNMANVTVNISTCTGIDELVNVSGFSLFPNPTNGILTLKITTGQTSNGLIEVTDAAGKRILQSEYDFNDKENSKEINIEKFASGIYFLTLTTSEKTTHTIKIIKE
ncbi:MAG: T9SS type A sorting domain-containing protein [Bacteroidetes bacterium]|nr:T9SS type A sorting domain-containing protein [Bacteroidota bacterium]